MYYRNLLTDNVFEADSSNYFGASNQTSDGKPMYAKITKKEFEAAEREADIAYFRELFPVGARVATSVVHVARSGMSRSIKVFAVIDGSISDVSWRVARLLREPFDNNHGGVKVSGCGMDMCFATVYNLGRTLYPEGFNPSSIGIRPVDGKRVNVNVGRGHTGPMTREEMAALVAKGWTFPDGGRNRDDSGWDTDGGYALKNYNV